MLDLYSAKIRGRQASVTVASLLLHFIIVYGDFD